MRKVVKEIIVLRYGHRDVRDYRVTSHCALVARALGARKIVVCEESDDSMAKSVNDVTSRWGGPFDVKFEPSWRKAITDHQKKGFTVCHLTMYGQPIETIDKKLAKKNKIMVVVGSQKVERGVYDAVDYNVSVTQQPHSEIAALAVFLDRVQAGKELKKKFKSAEVRIIPQERGKKVINLK